jgi:hypothetical protein
MPVLTEVLMLAPATLRSLVISEGGRTMSRKALGEVVNGFPPASKVSSKSLIFFQKVHSTQGSGNSYLVHNVKVLPHAGCRHGAEIFRQNVHESLQKCEGKKRVN